MTYRNHRKVIVVDGLKAFVGGMNIANEYYKKIKKYPRFRDTQLLIEGDAITSITQLFFMDYYYVTGSFIEDTFYYPERNIKSKGLVQLIPSGPEYKYPPIRNVYVKMINNAKQSIKIMTPYLALDQELVTSLIIASRGGVNVEIITSGVPDRKWVSYVSESFYEELLKEGIKIYQYQEHFTHGKVIIMDDLIASCGTYNLDNRSARMNFEVTMLLYKQGVDSLVKDFTLDRSKSKQIDTTSWLERGLIQRAIEGVLNILSPLV
jgi:cardiolipin synthase